MKYPNSALALAPKHGDQSDLDFFYEALVRDCANEVRRIAYRLTADPKKADQIKKTFLGRYDCGEKFGTLKNGKHPKVWCMTGPV